LSKRASHCREFAEEFDVVGGLWVDCLDRHEGLAGVDDVSDKVIGADAQSVEDVLDDVRLGCFVLVVPSSFIVDVGDVLGEFDVRGEGGMEGRAVQ
jgi:hypothetical protein